MKKQSWEEMLPGLLNLWPSGIAGQYLLDMARLADRQEAAVEEGRLIAEANEVALRAAMDEQ